MNVKTSRLGVALLAAVLFLGACRPKGPRGGTGTAMIGPEGGAIVLGTEVALEIPPGALARNVPVTLARSTMPATHALNPLSPRYVFGPPGLALAKPATIRVLVTDAPPRATLYWSAAADTAPSVENDDVGGTASGRSWVAIVSRPGSGFVGIRCEEGAPCTSASSCGTAEYRCVRGRRVCTETGHRPDGFACGADRVCAGGVCSPCRNGLSCPGSTPCIAATTSCERGPLRCVDRTFLPDGTRCGPGQVCHQGTCLPCQDGTPCAPGNPCRSGRTTCASGAPLCVEIADQPDGASCGRNRACRAGKCTPCTEDDRALCASPAATGSAGCRGEAGEAGRRTVTLEAAGLIRQYRVLAPPAAAGRVPLPLVFVFHAATGTMSTAESMGLPGKVPGAGAEAIFVYPQGILVSGHERLGNGWDQRCESPDMAFFDAMLKRLSSEYCVDLRRVFATGFSWGADMTDALSCCRGDVLRAVAPASGDEIDANPVCPARIWPAYRLTYADIDRHYTLEQFLASIEAFRENHGCRQATAPTEPAPCIRYLGCRVPVVACRYIGMGHDLPPHWAQDVWSFFGSFR